MPPAASGEGISQPRRWGFAGGAFQLARLRGAQEVSGLEEGEWCLDPWPRTHAVPNLSLDKGDEAADPLESSGVGCSLGRDGSCAGSVLGLGVAVPNMHRGQFAPESCSASPAVPGCLVRGAGMLLGGLQMAWGGSPHRWCGQIKIRVPF